ncbi:MAG TPA: DUF4260 domain-containing protein [Ferruginibacter sp.]|nr:DUF4260 domain-containing protein [Ferruginibacter sp.]
MKRLLQLEEAAILAACILLLYWFPVHLTWWQYVLLFFSPDLGMMGYAINPSIGALTYNLTHHKATCLIITAIGYYFAIPFVQVLGMLFLAHSAFDRVLGYGLKYPDDFKHTSIGQL